MVLPLLAALPLLAQNRITTKEAALGRQMAGEMRKRITPLESPTVQEYVDRLGQKLAAGAPDWQVPFTFELVKQDSCPELHEPASFPGGYVFVPAALLLAAHDEAEFAGMLAHAMAHAALPVPRQQTNLASVPLIFVGAQGGSCDAVAVPLGFVGTQRNVELQADAQAVRTMAEAGIDPQGLVQYLEREQPSTLKERSPIPPRDQRVAVITATIEGLERRNYPARGESGFIAAREEVRQLLASPKPTEPPTLRRN